MLMLSRHTNQSIYIGDDTKLTVLSADPDAMTARLVTADMDLRCALFRGETLRLPGGVKVTYTEKRSEGAKIGIEAPLHIVIDREEVRSAKPRSANPYQERIEGC